MNEYTVKGTRVSGNGWSYNLNNQKDAVKLCDELNMYRLRVEHLEEMNKSFDCINKQLKQVVMSMKILESDVDKLKKCLKCFPEKNNKREEVYPLKPEGKVKI